MKILLVDGYNLIGRKIPINISDENERKILIEQIKLISYKCNYHPVIIFDGNGSTNTYEYIHGLEIYFSSEDSSADDMIIYLLKNKYKSKECLVLTEDKILAENCRKLGAEIRASIKDIPLKKQKRVAKYSKDILNIDVGFWLNEFGLKKEE